MLTLAGTPAREPRLVEGNLMGKFGRRALVLLVAALSMLVVAACGGDDDERRAASEGGGGAGKSGGSITISQTSQPDYLDPALTLHGQRLGAAVARLYAAAHLQARRGRGGHGAHPGPRRGDPGDLRGRQDVELHASARDSSTPTARRSRPRTWSTPSSACSTWSPAPPRSSWASRGLRSTSTPASPRATSRASRPTTRPARSRSTLTQADGQILNVLAMNFAGIGARRHAVREPLGRSASGRRSVQVHEVGAQPRVRDGEERRTSTSRASRRATSTRSRPRSSSRPSGRPRT